MLASAVGPSALLQAFTVHADFRRAFQVKAQFQHRHRVENLAFKLSFDDL